MKTIFYSIFLFVIFLLNINIANAANLSAVNVTACSKLKNTTQPFILVLNYNDNLVQSILDCANNANLQSASLIGLGAIQQPKLGYFNLKDKKYQFKIFPGVYEITSLIGNVGFANGKRYSHIHVTLTNDQYQAIGGHLDNARVGVTSEITFIPLSTGFERKYNSELNFLGISTTS